MTAWPRHSDGSDKMYAELSQAEKNRVSLKDITKRAWNDLRALMAEQCLLIALKLMPKGTNAEISLAKALSEYTQSNNSAQP